ncbi:thioredoxin domain-containing protein [Besnoitia besnoiti]|uniref:Thioredoxin domain-containing protein n=1 Tax=Besnoitia besnoiti TaxID=94643 RepID=A0A2A9MHV1_BESBE|nr:thioredoxin domain-containing protein [Besnoitia besnoiti]PFH35526.1 thioredoxin domain-containing protein [Besnoitia besnoiti]
MTFHGFARSTDGPAGGGVCRQAVDLAATSRWPLSGTRCASFSRGSHFGPSPKNASVTLPSLLLSSANAFSRSLIRMGALLVTLAVLASGGGSLVHTSRDAPERHPSSISSFFSSFPSVLSAEARASPGKSRDFYRILGVKRNATTREIDKAYRKLAKQYHPDVNAGNEERFLDIARAHEVLSNEEERKKYDMFGEAGLGEGGGAPQGGQGMPFDFADMFGGMFGGGSGGPNIKFTFGGGDGGFGNVFPGGGGQGGARFQESPQDNASLYEAEDDEVAELGPQAVQRAVEGRDFVYFLALYNPRCRPCRQLKDEFVKAAKRMKDIVPFGAVNCSRFSNLSYCRDADHYPTLLFFLPDKSSRPIDYRGERTSAAMVRFLSENLPSTVVVLTDGSLESWLTKDPQMPKIVLFTDKKGIPPLFKFLSYQMRSQVALGVLFKNQTNLLAAFRAGLTYQKTHRSPAAGGKPLPNEIVFPSLLAIDDVDRLTGEWIDVKHHVNQELLVLTLSRVAAKARTASGVAFRELTARRMASGECGKDDSQFCFILLVSDRLASEEAPKDLFANLSELSEKFRRDPLKISWVNKDRQVQFASAFDLPAGQEVVFLAYRPKRKKYEVLAGVPQASTVESFVSDVVSGGKQLSRKLSKIPQLVKRQTPRATGHDEL